MRLLFSFCPLRFCSLLSRRARRDTDRVTLARIGTAVPRRILTALAIPSSQSSSLQVLPGAPTLRASAQACRKKRQVRKVFPLSLFCAEPLPRPALRCPVGHRNRDASLHSAIPSDAHAAQYKRISPYPIGVRYSVVRQNLPLSLRFARPYKSAGCTMTTLAYRQWAKKRSHAASLFFLPTSFLLAFTIE